MDELKALCEELLAWYEGEDYSEDGSDDWENAIVEKAMEVFCGEDVWDRINLAIARQNEAVYAEVDAQRLEGLKREVAKLEKRMKERTEMETEE